MVHFVEELVPIAEHLIYLVRSKRFDKGEWSYLSELRVAPDASIVPERDKSFLIAEAHGPINV